MSFRTVIVAATSILLASCVTTYGPKGMSGGYTETRLEEDVFRITVEANGYTSMEQAEEMVLLRAAELSLQNGYAAFVVTESRGRTKLSSYTSPITARTVNTGYGQSRTTFSGGDTYTSEHPVATATVLMLKEKMKGTGTIYDAAFLCGSLAPKFKTTCSVTPTQK